MFAILKIPRICRLVKNQGTLRKSWYRQWPWFSYSATYDTASQWRKPNGQLVWFNRTNKTPNTWHCSAN